MTAYKRLGFLHSSVERASGLLQSLYSNVRAYTPSALRPTVESAESAAASYTAPLLARAVDLGGNVLRAADENVNYVINTGNSAIATSKKTVQDGLTSVQTIHARNLQHLRSAFSSYLTTVQQTSDWAVKNLNPVRGVRAALDGLRAGLARLQELADPDTFAHFVQERWAAFASIPLVASVLDTVHPITNALSSIFYSLHDFVVSWGLYSTALDLGKSAWGWISESYPYRLGAQYLYPLVQPVADPTLAKLTKSKIINSTLDFWKPTTKGLIA